MVLYFGMRHWIKPRNLFEIIDIPDDLKSFVNDYKINLFEIAYLSDEQVNMFKSDFKIVADYFVQKRKNKKYIPSKQVIKHVEETMNLMKIITGDFQYNIDENIMKEMKGKLITMDTWLSDTIEKAEKKAELNTIYKIIEQGLLTIEQAANTIGLTQKQLLEDFKKYNLVI